MLTMWWAHEATCFDKLAMVWLSGYNSSVNVLLIMFQNIKTKNENVVINNIFFHIIIELSQYSHWQ